MIEYVGKSILIDKEVLVISDLHLGYGEVLRRNGVLVPTNYYTIILQEFETIFSHVGYVNEVVILGDLKHEIGHILRDERDEVRKLFVFLAERCNKITIVKGNHDVMLEYMVFNEKTKIVDFYTWKGYVFIHGDRDFPEIYVKEIHTWLLGHLHPAVSLREGTKEEKYKCFLVGSYDKKKIIIMPSFFPVNEGTDPRDTGMDIPWRFAFRKFEVKIVEGLFVLDFGLLGAI